MKRMILWMAMIFLLLPTTSCDINKIQSDKFQSELKNPDTFIERFASEAISADESPTFNINYRICDINDLVDKKDQFWEVLFQLSLWNKTSKPLTDLQIIAHFDENMQMILANSTWYNESIQLGAYSKTDESHGIGYTWGALIDLVSLGVLGGVDVASFHDVYIEIKWQDGHEIIHLEHGKTKWLLEDLEPVKILDQATVEEMNMRAYEQRVKKYGQ
ncbi:MAG: hypothetical protein GX815_06615 [Clostridiales bacterium]|nr:hypothetical protein [Clostridiales bacterium]